MALEAEAVITEHGLSIPEDISVLGFDDNPSGLYGQIALTTIRQPLFQMAEQAVRELSLIVEGKAEDLVRKVLNPELVVRDSCAPPQ